MRAKAPAGITALHASGRFPSRQGLSGSRPWCGSDTSVFKSAGGTDRRVPTPTRDSGLDSFVCVSVFAACTGLLKANLCIVCRSRSRSQRKTSAFVAICRNIQKFFGWRSQGGRTDGVLDEEQDGRASLERGSRLRRRAPPQYCRAYRTSRSPCPLRSSKG